MDNTIYSARLRFLDAGDVDDALVDFDGLDVFGRDGQKLGRVEGFIIDAEARRVNHAVIDAGGWFTTRRFLLPIGHATVSEDRRSLQVDVERETLRRLPEYDEDRFREFTDDELRAFERDTVIACCPDEPLEDVSAGAWGYDSRRHFAQPTWWQRVQYAPERLQRVERTAGDAHDPTAPVPVPPAQPGVGEEQGEISPHRDGRARPGDVLGIESVGERLAIGEAAEDGHERRRNADPGLADPDPAVFRPVR